MLNLKHLYYYHIFAKELSVTHASKKLGITAPALSTQLKQLEDFLGVPLTRRIGTKVVITDPGQIVLHYTTQMFAAYEELKNKISFSKSERRARFRVGVSQTVGARFAFDLLTLVEKTNLTLSESVHIIFDTAEKVMEGFAKDQFDLILGSFTEVSMEGTNWASQQLTFPVRIFAPLSMLDNRSEETKTECPTDLSEVIKIGNAKKISMVLPMPSALRTETDNALAKLKVRADRTIECNGSAAIIQLIERGFAYGLVPIPSLLDFRTADTLAVLGPTEGFWVHGISAMMPKGEGRSDIERHRLDDLFSTSTLFT